MPVTWVTQNIGIYTSVKDEIDTSKDGTIIIDLNNINTNTKDDTLIGKTIGKILAVAANREMKIILEAKEVEVPAYLMASIFVYATGLSWEDAINLIKSKVSFSIDTELYKTIKEVVKY